MMSKPRPFRLSKELAANVGRVFLRAAGARHMTQQPRRQMLIKAVHDAAIELATRAYRGQYPPTPMPDEPVIMVAPIESPTEGPYLDDKRPTPDEIRAAAAVESRRRQAPLDITDTDEFWVAYVINTVSGGRYAGLGRTAAEAKASAWINSHWPGGTTSVSVKISTQVPDDWTFALYPPLKPKPQTLAISSLAIFELVRLTVPDVTRDEVANIIMQSLPYMGRRQ
jgi:hypothetical protein